MLAGVSKVAPKLRFPACARTGACLAVLAAAACLMLWVNRHEWRFSAFHDAAPLERLWRARYSRRGMAAFYLSELRQDTRSAAPDGVPCALQPVSGGADRGPVTVGDVRRHYKENVAPRVCVVTVSVSRSDPSNILTQSVGTSLGFAGLPTREGSRWASSRPPPRVCSSRAWEDGTDRPLAHVFVLDVDANGHPEAAGLADAVTVVRAPGVLDDPLATAALDRRQAEFETCASAHYRWELFMDSRRVNMTAGAALRAAAISAVASSADVVAGLAAGLPAISDDGVPMGRVPSTPEPCTAFAAFARRRDIAAGGSRASRRVPWREWPKLHRRHTKATLDYALALDFCSSTVGSDLTLVLEDDALLSRGWLASLLDAIVPEAEAIAARDEAGRPGASAPSTLPGSEPAQFGLDGRPLAASVGPSVGVPSSDGGLFTSLPGSEDGVDATSARWASVGPLDRRVTWVKLFYPDFLEQWGSDDAAPMVAVSLVLGLVVLAAVAVRLGLVRGEGWVAETVFCRRDDEEAAGFRAGGDDHGPGPSACEVRFGLIPATGGRRGAVRQPRCGWQCRTGPRRRSTSDERRPGDSGGGGADRWQAATVASPAPGTGGSALGDDDDGYDDAPGGREATALPADLTAPATGSATTGRRARRLTASGSIGSVEPTPRPTLPRLRAPAVSPPASSPRQRRPPGVIVACSRNPDAPIAAISACVVVGSLLTATLLGAGRAAATLYPWQQPGIHGFGSGCCIVATLYPRTSAAELSHEMRTWWASEADFSDFSLPFAAEAHHSGKLRLVAVPHIAQHVGFVSTQLGMPVAPDGAGAGAGAGAGNASDAASLVPQATPTASPKPLLPAGTAAPAIPPVETQLLTAPPRRAGQAELDRWAEGLYDRTPWLRNVFGDDFGFSAFFDEPPEGSPETGGAGR